MSTVCTALSQWTADVVLLPALKLALVVVVLVAVLKDWAGRARAEGRGGTGSAKIVVTRGEKSMAVFYGLYGVITGLLVALGLSVEVAKEHRVFWSLADIGLVAHVCLLNQWFRNYLIGRSIAISKAENR